MLRMAKYAIFTLAEINANEAAEYKYELKYGNQDNYCYANWVRISNVNTVGCSAISFESEFKTKEVDMKNV